MHIFALIFVAVASAASITDKIQGTLTDLKENVVNGLNVTMFAANTTKQVAKNINGTLFNITEAVSGSQAAVSQLI